MKRFSNAIFNRRLLALTLCSAVILSLVASGLTLLVPITPSTAQTNPQTTDTFTGQFIPAYFGAAYDPTEAYKQMAGLEVLVFGYDTWGTIVNNFAYRTQIKANGSFQAAGLPNASHYGVCLNVSDNDVSLFQQSPFRSPLPEDNIQGTFAYSQAQFDKPATANTQTGKQAVFFPFHKQQDKDDQSCRVFVTSNRTVDIANHINVFPLVPNQVLSVRISDSKELQTSGDPNNYNTPYEIYAQRITIMQQSYAASADPVGPSEGGTTTTTRIVNGPVIRGRTIPAKDSNGLKTTTVFQAYAPTGLYAITYWRTDIRNPNVAITYLNYTGGTPLNTSYNGLAFEEAVASNAPGSTIANNKAWSSFLVDKDYTYRVGEDRESYDAWYARKDSGNLWGIVKGLEGNELRPVQNQIVTVDDPKLKLVDIKTRKCIASEGDNSIGAYGVYFFTSNCPNALPGLAASYTSRSVSLSIQESELIGTDSSYQGMDNITVRVPVTSGPGRSDQKISLSSTTAGLNGVLQKDGIKLINISLDLKTSTETYRNITQTNGEGEFTISGRYFNNTPLDKYQIIAHIPNSHGPGYEPYHINIKPGSMQNPATRLNSLGLVSINSRDNVVSSYLAQLNLPNLLSLIKVPEALAQSAQPEYTKTNQDLHPDDLQIPIDISSIKSLSEAFTIQNYDLSDIKIVAPDEAGLGGSYSVFNRPDKNSDGSSDNTENKAGIITDSNSRIIAVQLKAKTDIKHPYWAYFQDNNLIKDNPNEVVFRLKTTFVRTETAEGTEEGAKDATDESLQSQDKSTLPATLSADWPIKLKIKDTSVSHDKLGNNLTDGVSNDFLLDYAPIVLTVEPPTCGSSSWLSKIPVIGGAADAAQSVITNFPCFIVVGSIGLLSKGVEWISQSQLFILDPLKYGFVTPIWNMVRNLVNSLAVLILIIVGVAIMLRYESKTYNIQTVLKNLIITVIAINFSILIIQLALDATNVITTGLYRLMIDSLTNIRDAGEFSGSGIAGAAAGMAALGVSIAVLVLSSGGTAVLGLVALIAGLFILGAWVFMRVIVDYAMRMAVLIACLTLAPAAIAANILPGTKTYYKKWQGMVVGTLAAQIAFAACLGLGMGLLITVPTTTGGFFDSMLMFILAVCVFYSATKVPNKVAAMMGASITANLEGIAKKGLMAAGGRVNLAGRNVAKQLETRRAMQQDEAYQKAGTLGRLTFGMRNSIQQRQEDGVLGLLGINGEEQEKIKHEAWEDASKSDNTRRNRAHRKEIAIDNRRIDAANRLIREENERRKSVGRTDFLVEQERINIEENKMIDYLNEHREEGEKERKFENLKYRNSAANAQRAFERQQETADTLSKEEQQQNITNLRMSKSDEIEFERQQQRLDAESKVRTELTSSTERMDHSRELDFERGQKELDANTKTVTDLNIAAQRMNQAQEVAYRRQQDARDAETEAATKLDQDKLKLNKDRIDTNLGRVPLSERLREQTRLDNLNKTQTELQTNSIKTADPNLLQNDRQQTRMDSVAKTKGEVDLMKLRRDNPDVTKVMRTIARDSLSEEFGKRSARVFLGLAPDENRTTNTFFEINPPTVRLDGMDGNSIFDLSNRDASGNLTLSDAKIELIVKNMFTDKVSPQAQKDITKLIKDRLDAKSVKEIETVGDYTTTFGSEADDIKFYREVLSKGGVAAGTMGGVQVVNEFRRHIDKGAAKARDVAAIAATGQTAGAYASQVRREALARTGRTAPPTGKIPPTAPPVVIPLPLPEDHVNTGAATPARTWRDTQGLPEIVVPSNLDIKVDLTRVETDMDALNTYHEAMNLGTSLSPDEEIDYKKTYQRLRETFNRYGRPDSP